METNTYSVKWLALSPFDTYHIFPERFFVFIFLIAQGYFFFFFIIVWLLFIITLNYYYYCCLESAAILPGFVITLIGWCVCGCEGVSQPYRDLRAGNLELHVPEESRVTSPWYWGKEWVNEWG